MSLLSWLLAEARSLSLGPPWRSVHSGIWHFLSFWFSREGKRAQDGSHLTMSAGHYRFRWPAWSQCKTEPHKARYTVTATWDYLGFLTPHKTSCTNFMTFWTIVLYVSSESAREERLLERLSHQVSLRKEARRQSFWTSNWHPFL